MFDPATASYLLGLVVAVAGGFFGAAIGGNFAFAITGITVLTSFGIYLGTDSTAGFTYLAFGPFVGPHVAFAGGVGAAAIRRSPRIRRQQGRHQSPGTPG